jgi:hypothetical protein
VEFGRLDVPLAILAASAGYFPGFDRTQDRGFVQSSGRRGRCKAVRHGAGSRCVGGGAKRCNGLINASLFFSRIGKDAGAGHLERSSAICRPFDIIFG